MKDKRKVGKVTTVFYILFVIAALVTIMTFSINAYVKASVKDRIITSDEASEMDADCILVLGAGVYNNGVPSAMLVDRLLLGIELYDSGISDRLLMSGDHGREEYDEVNTMKQYAIARGVPSSNIFMDHAGFSTYESLYRARDIFHAKKIIIITQDYHLYRALYVAEALGIEAYGVASDQRRYVGEDFREMREILARTKDFVYAILKPEPTYLGEAIPVSGDGDLTNDTVN